MKRTVWRLFWSADKEEAWLNRMASKGYALTDYFWARYVFEETDPGEYIYRLDLLDGSAKSPEGTDYIRFLEGSGAELVATYMRWVYFRKKAGDGSFELYTDLPSRYARLKKLRHFYSALTTLELLCGVVNLSISLLYFLSGDAVSLINVILGLLMLAIGVTFLVTLVLPVQSQIRRVRYEMNFFEG